MFSRSKLPVGAACVVIALLPLSAFAKPDLEFELANRDNLDRQRVAISDWQALAAAGAATDNAGGRDLVILQFDRLVSLNRVDMVWVGREFDVTIPPDQELRSLIEVGWELIGQQVERLLGSVEVRERFVSSWSRLSPCRRPVTQDWKTCPLTSVSDKPDQSKPITYPSSPECATPSESARPSTLKKHRVA